MSEATIRSAIAGELPTGSSTLTVLEGTPYVHERTRALAALADGSSEIGVWQVWLESSDYQDQGLGRRTVKTFDFVLDLYRKIDKGSDDGLTSQQEVTELVETALDDLSHNTSIWVQYPETVARAPRLDFMEPVTYGGYLVWHARLRLSVQEYGTVS